jgi:hypothetical protein
MNTKTLPRTVPDEASVPAPDEIRGGDELIFPNSLLPEERVAAEVLVMRCPQFAQPMLDELAARMNLDAIRVSPIGYLRGMVKRAQAGEFVPELGVRVAATRCQRQEATALRAREEAERQRLNAERASPEHQAKIAKHREEMRKIMESMASPKTRRKTP